MCDDIFVMFVLMQKADFSLFSFHGEGSLGHGISEISTKPHRRLQGYDPMVGYHHQWEMLKTMMVAVLSEKSFVPVAVYSSSPELNSPLWYSLKQCPGQRKT